MAAQDEALAQLLEEHRPRLHAVAYRILGSADDADDAVQEAWLRLQRTGLEGIENPGGWLTTTVARLCLDTLRSRKSRREAPIEPGTPEPIAADDPEQEAVLADGVGPALLVVLGTLSPAERVAFVLHDVFDVPFEEIAPVVGKTTEAARQLASRARRRVRGAPEPPATDVARQREVVAAFLAASRSGDFEALLALLDPNAVVRADEAGVRMGSPAETRGARGVAGTFSGRAQGAELALIDGVPGLAWQANGRLVVVFRFQVKSGLVTAVDLVADQETIAGLDVQLGEAG